MFPQVIIIASGRARCCMVRLIAMFELCVSTATPRSRALRAANSVPPQESAIASRSSPVSGTSNRARSLNDSESVSTLLRNSSL